MRVRRVLVAVALTLGAPSVARAQEPPPAPPAEPDSKAEEPADDTPVTRLPEVVVTPTRTARDPFDTAAAVRALDADVALEKRGARTIAEALGQLPGVGVQKTAQGQGTVFLRGLTGYHTLLLFDGVRLNNSIFRSGPNEYLALVDPYQLDRMEIVDGPGSVLYGSDAVGGSVNLITRRIEQGEKAGWRRRLLWRFDSADQSNTVRAEFEAWDSQGLGVRVGGTWRDFDTLEGGRHVGTQPRTDFDALGADAAIEYAFDKNVMLRATVFHSDLDDVWRTHKTVFGVSWHGTTVGNELARVLDYERTHAAAHLDVAELGWLREVRVSLVGGRHVEIQDRTKASGGVDPDEA